MERLAVATFALALIGCGKSTPTGSERQIGANYDAIPCDDLLFGGGAVGGSEYSRVRLLSLLVDGPDFTNQKVESTGVLSTEFEDERLYLSQEHFDFGISDNAIRVSLPTLNDDQKQCLHGRIVAVYGVVMTDEAGRYPGAVVMESVRRIATAGIQGRK